MDFPVNHENGNNRAASQDNARCKKVRKKACFCFVILTFIEFQLQSCEKM
jgi:hypothetical protein